MSHPHGPVICKECRIVLRECKCLKVGQTEELVVCPACVAERAYQVCQQTYELNQKLKELGVSVHTDASKVETK